MNIGNVVSGNSVTVETAADTTAAAVLLARLGANSAVFILDGEKIRAVVWTDDTNAVHTSTAP